MAALPRAGHALRNGMYMTAAAHRSRADSAQRLACSRRGCSPKLCARAADTESYSIPLFDLKSRRRRIVLLFLGCGPIAGVHGGHFWPSAMHAPHQRDLQRGGALEAQSSSMSVHYIFARLLAIALAIGPEAFLERGNDPRFQSSQRLSSRFCQCHLTGAAQRKDVDMAR